MQDQPTEHQSHEKKKEREKLPSKKKKYTNRVQINSFI